MIEAGEYKDRVDRRTSIVGERGEVINASGHRDQLKRHYGLLSICGLALTIDNAWVALGGSIAVSICESGLCRAATLPSADKLQITVDRLGSCTSFSCHASTMVL